jgi:6-methylsalicylate decarboxylase
VAAFVRPRFPTLRICFAMLAGLAPVHTERRESRGVAIGPDPNAWYDTSSYGPRACEAVIAATGAERLVHGSDRPIAAARPLHGDPALAALIGSVTPRRLLDDSEVHA